MTGDNAPIGITASVLSQARDSTTQWLPDKAMSAEQHYASARVTSDMFGLVPC